MIRPLEASEVTFEVKVEPEYLPLEGNVMASGDDAADKAAENDLRERLERGDALAWCCVVVVAKWRDYTAFDSLGGCTLSDSDADLESLVTEHGMRESALDNLNQAIKSAYETLQERIA